MSRKRDKIQYVIEALTKIDRHFLELPIFTRPLPIAVYNYVAASEIKIMANSMRGLAQANNASRMLVEAGLRAIPALYERCAESVVVPHSEETTIQDAIELLDFAHRYEQIKYAFGLVEKGQLDYFVAQREPRITFAYASSESDRLDTRLRSLEALQNHAPQSNVDMAKSAVSLFDVLAPVVTSTRSGWCNYEYNDDVIAAARIVGRDDLSITNRLEVPGNAPIVDGSFEDLHKFWAALMSMSNVHTAAHMIGATAGRTVPAINTIVLCKPKAEFVYLLSKISELPEHMVAQMLDWYTFDRRIAVDNPLMQPFLPLNEDLLCLPTVHVKGNSFERNFMKLLHRHPKLRGLSAQVDSQLEPAALASLAQMFPEPQYKTLREIDIPGVTDVDLLVFDFVSNTTLVIQHKWLIAPELVKESASNDEKLSEGVSQALKSRDYLRTNHPFLKTKLRLSQNQQIGAIEGVVVCRGFEGTGFLGNPIVPIVREDSFRELVTQTNDLNELCSLMTARPDHDQSEAKSEDMQMSLRLYDYEFVFPGMVMALDDNFWRPFGRQD